MAGLCQWDDSDTELDEAFVEEEMLQGEDDPFIQLRMQNAATSPTMQVQNSCDEWLGQCCTYFGYGCLCELCSTKVEWCAAYAKMLRTADHWRCEKHRWRQQLCGGCATLGRTPMCRGCTIWLAAKEAHEEWEQKRSAFKRLRRVYKQRRREWEGLQRRRRRFEG